MWAGIVVLVGLASSGCFITPVRTFGAGKSRQQVVHEQATQLTPTRVHAVGTWSGDVQTRKVRVWADDEFRAQNVHWQQTFQEILDDANDILAAQFGIRLVPELASWSYRGAPGQPLEDTLRALAAHDPGSDVFGVIGLTSSLSVVTATFDTIGMASTPGKHLVIRGYSDIHERAAMESYFEDLTKSERGLMFDARKHHKRLTLLLHELGHNFGAPHASVPSSVMTPSYSVQATQFDEDSRTAINANLDQRLGRSSQTTKPADKPVVPDKPPVVERKPLQLDPKDKSPVIVIVVDADGTRTIDGKFVGESQLDGVFLLAAERSKQTRIYVRIEAGSPPAIVNAIVERAKKSGFTRVVVTDD